MSRRCPAPVRARGGVLQCVVRRDACDDPSHRRWDAVAPLLELVWRIKPWWPNQLGRAMDRGEAHVCPEIVSCRPCQRGERPPTRREDPRTFVPPLGWPFHRPRVVCVTPANRLRHPLIFNRYPRQVIGVGIRLPDDVTTVRRDSVSGRRYGHHRSLSITWSKPARWWR